jgi:hypothetical protein
MTLSARESYSTIAGLNCDKMVMEYTHDEWRIMLLTLGPSNSRVGLAYQE